MERRIKAWKLIQAEQPRRVFRFNIDKSALMKQLMNHLHSKKGQERTQPSSLWMRYRAVVQKTLSSP